MGVVVKVLVATVVHTPLDARIHHRQIRALRADGIEVTQLAPWSATGTAPNDGVDGVVAVDVPRAVGRNRATALRAARRAIVDLGPRHDLVLLHDPELVVAVMGRLHRLPPVVLDVHEDLAASLRDRRWVPAPLRGLAAHGARGLERWAERHLASLLLAEEGYATRFLDDHPVVPNLPWRSAEPAAVVDTDRVVYVGRLSRGRGAAELVAIADRLAAHGGPRLELIGPADDDVARLLRAAEARGTLRWHGFVPNDEAMALVRGSLVGLAPLHDLPNYRVSMPTKVVEYLANGVPAIVTPLPEAVRLVEDAGAGMVVPFGDVSETVTTILALAADPMRRSRLGAAAWAYVGAAHCWDTAGPRFVAHLRDLAAETEAGTVVALRRPPGAASPSRGDHPPSDRGSADDAVFSL